MKNQKIKSFKDLIVWQKSHNFSLLIYEVTKKFPKYEKFSLTDQIRRASISIPSNIAEGFSKNTKKDKVRFYNISNGSLMEVLSQIQLAKDLNYLSLEKFKEIEEKVEEISKLIFGITRSATDKKTDMKN